MSPNHFKYRLVQKEDDQLIRSWFEQDFLAQWIHGKGLQNTLEGLQSQYISKSIAQYWLAYLNEEKIGVLITCPIDKKEEHFTKITFGDGAAISLDVFICLPHLLNKGIGSLMINHFLKNNFNNISDVTIDPEVTNKRAIHVYKKLGFKIINKFIASWHTVPHYLMHLKI